MYNKKLLQACASIFLNVPSFGNLTGNNQPKHHWGVVKDYSYKQTARPIL